MSNLKAYLGDSVYADVDELGSLVLTTENGYHDDPRNIIYLVPEVLLALENYVTREFKRRLNNEL